MAVDLGSLRTAIGAAGFDWRVRIPPPNERHALGLLPSDEEKTREAIDRSNRLIRNRLLLTPPPARGRFGEIELESAGARMTVAAARASIPKDMDRRDRGIIGKVADQEWCGSFAVTGLVAAMAWKELGLRDLTLSAADEHFCSSHGANCGGWNTADALEQVKSRGVVPEEAFAYMTAFDNPPVGDPNDVPDHLWLAFCRGQMNRTERRYRISDYSAWPSSVAGLPFDARKFYLANYGPMVLGFTVYEDFDHYGGGVFKHVAGKSRGSHCVLVVGYSDTHQAWVCRNSWGDGFGGSAQSDGTGGGYFMIAYGDSNIEDTFYGCHGVVVPPSSRLAQRAGDVNGDGITELIVTSPWGIGILKAAGATMAAVTLSPNGTHIGNWLLNTADNQFGPVADYDGDGRAEIFTSSTWGVGILQCDNAALNMLFMSPNGSQFGGWTLDTSLDRFGPAADFDGDGRAEILVSNPSGMAILKWSGGAITSIVAGQNGTRFDGWLLDLSNNSFGPAADFDGDGAAECIAVSPWGIGLLKLQNGTLTTPVMAPNGTRFGGWLLDTSNYFFGETGDYDADHASEMLITSPWGLGILKLSGATFTASMLQPTAHTSAAGLLIPGLISSAPQPITTATAGRSFS